MCNLVSFCLVILGCHSLAIFYVTERATAEAKSTTILIKRYEAITEIFEIGKFNLPSCATSVQVPMPMGPVQKCVFDFS